MTERPQLAVIHGGEQPHRAETRPEPQTVKRERDGRAASLLDPAAYPLLATCAGCGALIRCAHYLADWSHDLPPAPAPPRPRAET